MQTIRKIWEYIVRNWRWFWWHWGIQILFVLLPTLFATNAIIPCLDKPFRTIVFSFFCLEEKACDHLNQLPSKLALFLGNDKKISYNTNKEDYLNFKGDMPED
ncbi:MAG: hypothetical protein E3K37_11915 [Candidatus Kuenenia sp.]|nr:hypothetical protein [Candidatus Kuenenia hertensis]